MNIIALFHAYKFTHFAESKTERTKSPESLTAFDKFRALLFGVNNPRPENNKMPGRNYKVINLSGNKKIECWQIESEKKDSASGTVIMFHGYGGNKSSLLGKSEELNKSGYNTFAVDFMGSGGSEGNRTTLGYEEAEEVKTAFDYIKAQGEKNIYLFGTSMGSAAILKAISDNDIHPKGIIIECPFGSMYQTTCARFKIMNAPVFPMAGLLVFWGGVQNGFWGFGHNPAEYAKKVNCPALLLYGEEDRKVSRAEIDEIYTNMHGVKFLKTYKYAGHDDYFVQYKDEWTKDVTDFLKKVN
ncbi:MAG: alpha/beta hydrolase [Ignavibacteria bacterium]|nr:alpha/beta hydrolase [Ignavibacteria bacterium]